MVAGTESARKIQFYNYQRVLEIVKAELFLLEDRKYLETMEAAARCREPAATEEHSPEILK
jgi:hypothetical protein